VPPVEVEPVGTPAVGRIEGDLARRIGAPDVEDAQPARVAGRPRRIRFVVDQHEAVPGAHLVAVRVEWHVDPGDHPRICRVSDVEDRRPQRGLHVTDVAEPVAQRDLPAPGNVGEADPA
jgi:hypothetical protein